MVLLADDKMRLAEWRVACKQRLERDRLTLHPHKAHITPVCLGIDLLGYFVFPEQRRLRIDNGHRFVRKLRRLAKGYAQERLNWDDINPSVQSWIGHAKQADTFGLRKKIFSAIVFQQGLAFVCCAAALGTAERSTCARRTGTGKPGDRDSGRGFRLAQD